MTSVHRFVTVFCGSRTGYRPSYAAAARAFGEALGREGLHLVYGGGHVGMMGVLADAVLAAGGQAVGVIPHHLARLEVAHQDLTELIIVDSMHERKAKMADLGFAFVALPGGIGTLEELIEAMTWGQLGLHAKPCWLLDVDDYWAPLVDLLDHAVDEGFFPPEQRRSLRRTSDPDQLARILAASPDPR